MVPNSSQRSMTVAASLISSSITLLFTCAEVLIRTRRPMVTLPPVSGCRGRRRGRTLLRRGCWGGFGIGWREDLVMALAVGEERGIAPGRGGRRPAIQAEKGKGEGDARFSRPPRR